MGRSGAARGELVVTGVARGRKRRAGPAVDPDGLLCALVLAPQTYARNRFFGLFEDPQMRRVRRRAARVRGIIRQLVGHDRPKGEIVGEQVLDDGHVLLRYRVEELAFERTTALSAVEAAALRYALHRVGAGPLDAEDAERVERALERLGEPIERAKLEQS